MPIYTTKNGDLVEFNSRKDAAQFEQSYPDATVDFIMDEEHFDVPVGKIDAFQEKYPDADFWSSTRANQAVTSKPEGKGFFQRMFSMDNLNAAVKSFGNHNAMNAQTPVQPRKEEIAQQPATQQSVQQEQQPQSQQPQVEYPFAAQQNVGDHMWDIAHMHDNENQEKPRFDYRHAENGFVNPATQKSDDRQTFTEGLKRAKEDDEILKKVTLKPEETADDVYENAMMRFSNTEEGIAMQDEADEAMRQHVLTLQDEFTRSKEYKDIVSHQPTTEEEAAQMTEQLNQAFQEKYGAEMEKFMQPYQEKMMEAVQNRYGDSISEGMRKVNAKAAENQVTELQSQVNEMQGKQGQTHGGTLRAANHLLEETQEVIEAAKRGDTGFLKELGRGFWDNLDARNFTWGISDALDATNLKIALDAAEKGEQLSKEQEALLDAHAVNMIVSAYFGSDLSRGYKAGQMTAESLPFMLDIITNPISASGNAVAKGLLKYGMKKFGAKTVNRAVPRFLGRVAGESVAAAGMTSTTGLPRVLGETIDRLNANFNVTIGDDGKPQVQRVDNKSTMEALSEAVRSNFFEYQSESVFNALRGFNPLKGMMSKVMPEPVNKIIGAVKSSGVGRVYKNTFGNKTMKEIAQRAQFHGLPEEYMEEVYNNFANVATGDMSLKDATDLDKNIDTFLGLAPTSVLFGAIGVGGYAYERYQNRKNMNRAFGQMNDQQREQLAQLQEMAAGNQKEAINREVKRFLQETIVADNLTQEEKRAEIEYLFEFVKQNAIGEIGAERTPEERAVDDAEESRMAGYDTTEPETMNEAKNDYEAALADMENSFSPETIAAIDANPTEELRLTYMNPSYSDADRQHVLDYVNAKQRYDGMVQRVRDDIDGMIQASDAEIDSQVNTGTGMVQPATLKVDNRQVHIIDGNVALLEDGSIDTANSTRDIIVRDAQTGKVEFVSPSAFLGVDEAMDPAALKQQAAENIRQTKAQQAADQIDGVLPFQQGDTYDGVDAEGQPVQVQIISDNGDGTVNVGINGEAAGVPMQKEAVQQLVDNARRAQAVARREDAASQRAKNTNLSEPSRSMTEGKDAYSLNEEVRVILPDGSEGTAIIRDGLNADGQYLVEFMDEAGNSAWITDENGNSRTTLPMTADQLNAMQPAEAQAEAGQQSAPTNEAVSSGLSGKQEQPAGQATETPSAEVAPEVVPQNDTTDAMPMIGEGEDMEPDFAHATPQRTQQYLYEESGLEQDEADDFVKDMKKRAQTEKTKLEGKKPKLSDRGIDNKIPKFQKAKAAWQQQVDDAQRKVDYWNSVEQDQQMKQRQAREAAEAERLAAMTDEERLAQQRLTEQDAQNLEEIAAQMIGSGSIKLNRDSYKQETGYSESEAKKMFRIFATDGMSVSRAGEQIEQAAREAGIPFDETDANAGRNAVISVLQSAETWGDLLHYIEKNRQAEADALLRAAEREQEELLDRLAVAYNFASGEDYRAYEEFYLPMYLSELDAATGEEYYAAIADDINHLNEIENGERTDNSEGEGSPAVLPEEQPSVGNRESTVEGQVESEGSTGEVPSEERPASEEASRGEVEIATSEQLKPIGRGAFGDIYDQFRGKPSEAIAFLIQKQDGEALGALHHKDIGEIDLVWGKAGTKKSDGYGLAKLVKYHPEVLDNLQEILDDMHVTERSENRIQLESETHQAAVRLTWDNKKKNWLLTAFEKKETSEPTNSRTDVESNLEGMSDDTATRQDSDVSESKDNTSSDNNQENQQENEEQIEKELESRIEVQDLPTWPETATENGIEYHERVVVDGKYNVLKVDAPDEKGNYTGSYYLYEGKRFGSIVEVVDYIDGKQSVQQQIEAARKEVAQNPTEAQKEAGNYKKGHIKLDGYDISIENPKGSTRSGVDEQGKEWSVTMNNDYGYLRGTEGVDGDHIDVFLSDEPTEGNVFVVDQVKPDGSFDEHKVMYGFATADEARAAYLANYSPGWTGLGAITEVSKDEFKKWVESSHRKTRPFAEYKSVKPISGQNEGNTSYSNIVALLRECSRLWEEYFDLPRESEVPEEQKEDARKRQDEASSKWIESINRLRAAISRLSDEEIAGIEDALGEEYGYVSRYVEEIQKNREVRHTLTQVFEDGITAQGEVTGKDNGKDAKPEDYTKDNEEQRPVLHGTFHDPEGYAVVTNARVLLADKKGFEKSHGGKVVAHREIAGNKKGDVIEGNFPKWKNVIKPVEDHKDATLDAAKLLDFIAGAEERMKSQWKQEKDNGQTKQSFSNWSADADLVVRMPDGTVIGFNFNNLRLFAKGTRQIGADSVEYTDRDKGIAARSDSGVVTVMPKLIEGEGNEGRRFFYDMSETGPEQPSENKDNTPSDNTKENGDLFAEAETDASESQPTDKPLVGKALDKAIRHAREELRQARAKLSMANALNSPYTEEERKEKAAEVEKWEKELERLTGMKKEAPTASASVRASTPNKIEDFGEKIGGARKDVARGRIRDTKQLSVKDLTTLKKGADDILSQANILRLYREGQMDEQTARSFMAFNNVVKLALKKGYGNKDIVLGKYRDAAVAWEEGKPFSFEITEQDVKDRMAMFARATEEGVRQDLEYAIKEPYDDFMQTYEALNYPAEERKLGNYVIKDYTKSKHVVSKISYPFWVKNGYRAQRGYPFRTLADAVTKIKNLCPLVEAKDKNGKSKGESTGHGLHVAKDGSFYYVKSRNIPGTIYLSRKFFNERDAKKFLEDNLEKLKEREQRMVDALMGSSIGMAEREGVDYRGGRDVTPQDFLDEFGFRGVEFGNWVPQAERQLYLNKTYDAIEDLCAIVGISPKAFSLGGRLGLAFGARGHGRAMAHYESGKEVINLTRMSGTGSLAHEWFHALDNYLARQKSGNVSDFATETHDTVRTEVGRAFSALYDKMRSLDYHRRSQRAGREYWGKTVEEFARLFENYIYNKLAERQTISPVLVREDTLLDQIEDEYTRNAWPYPSRAENEEMKPLFDSLFETIQEETDGNGNIVLFQKVDGSEMKRDADAAETALRGALIDTMREAGIDVITDAEAGQQVLDMANEEATLSRDKKRASESVSVSSEEEHLQAVDSDAGTKIIHNLENLAKNIENIKQSPIKTFLGEVARAIGARKQGSNSQYATFETKNGQIVTIRLADHNAHTSGFDNSGRNNGISIVVSPKKNNGVNNDGKAHVVEYYYDAIKLRRAEGKPLAQIVRSIQQALYSGEYKDTTGLAKREEVNPDGTQEIMGKVQFFRTSNGDAYGFTVNGKIYIDPRIATAETPIHEYGHLWTAALRKANPAAWERLKEQLLGQKDVVDYVKSLYPELNGDALMDEIFQHYAGKRGAERLRSELQRLLAENKADGGKIRAMFETIRKALDYFWNMARDLFTGNNANLKRITAENFADMMLADLLNGYKPELNASNEMRELRRDSERRIQREETNHVVDEAISAITGKDIKEVRRERMNREEQRRREAKEIYQNVLSGNFNDVTLQQINDYINDVTPNNPYGRRLSERLPQRVGRRVESEKGISAVDALFSRISESSVRPNERTRSEGRRKIEEQKKELLKLWAQATGHWHTDLSAFTDDIEPIGSGTDSDVYSSKDGRYVIKASKGKPIGKRFRPDIDNIPLFNSLFPHMAYEILGYGEIDGNFVRILRQPAVDFENSEPLTEAERVGFMGSLGFYPINKGNTSFSNGEIIVADLQKSNVVRDSDGIIQVIDADVRLHTKDMGGNYDYLPVEHDLPMQSDAKENGEEAAVFFQVSEDAIQRRSQAQKVATNAVLQALQNARVPVQTVSDKEALQMLLLSMNGTDWKRVRDAAEAGRRYGQQRYYVVNLEDPTHINEAFYYETKDAAQKDAAYYNRLGWGSFVMLDLDSEKNVASELENPERIAAQVEFLKVKGKVYGWTDGKTIYLTKRGMNPNTTIHEYTHLWAASLQRTNPELWGQMKDLLRRTPVWADVTEDTNYRNIWNNEDAIASEALSRISGRENGNYLTKLSERAVRENGALDAASIIDRVRRALDFFWNWVGTHVFGMKEFRNIGQVTDRILYDLMSGEQLTFEQGEEMAFNVAPESYQPTKTGKGYKVFVLKDGQLYPPMVANPNGAATPVGVWLEAHAAPVAGTSKTGRPQVKAGGKGTQGGSGTLAYRPGWHLGEIPYAKQFNRKDESGEKQLFPNNFVWAEVEYANDVDYQEEARKEGTNENGKYQHSLAGLKRVPENGSYRYRTNPDPTTDEWIITGAMKVNRILTPSEVDAMVRTAGREPQKRQEGAVTDEQVNALNEQLGLAGSGVRFREIYRRNSEVAYNFARKNKGVGRVAVVNAETGYDILRQRGVDAAKAREVMNAFKAGDTGRYLTKYDLIIAFDDGKVSEEELNSYLWHEATHRVIHSYGIPQDTVNAIASYIKGIDRELYDKVMRLYGDSSEEVKNEEVLAWFMEDMAKTPEELIPSVEASLNNVDPMDQQIIGILKLIRYGRTKQSKVTYSEVDRGSQGTQGQTYNEVRLSEGTDGTGGRSQTEGNNLRGTGQEFSRRGTEIGGKAEAREAYEAEVARAGHQVREALQDSMRSLHALYKAVLGDEFTTIDDVPGFENAYTAENRLSSESKAQQNYYKVKFFKPLVSAMYALTGINDKDGSERMKLTDYMMAKHGLERNVVLAERDARRASEGWLKDALVQLGGRLKTGEIDQAQYDTQKEAYEQQARQMYDEQLAANRQKDYSGLMWVAFPEEMADATQKLKDKKISKQEYNDIIKRLWPQTEPKARQMVDDYETPKRKPAIDNLWKAVRDATHETLRKTYEGGLMSKEAYESTLGMFQYYIPLRGFDEQTSDEVYDYLTSSDGPLLGSVLKTAGGRRSKADDPITYISQMADKAIMEANRNRMKQTFMNFVLNHPSDLVSVSDMWIRFNDASGEWEPELPPYDPNDSHEENERKRQVWEENMIHLANNAPDTYKRASEAPNIPYRVLNNNLREHQVLVKRNGRTYILAINGSPRAAQALNGLTNPDTSTSKDPSMAFFKGIQKGTRFIAQNVTSRSPGFMLRNFIRDGIYANVTVSEKENKNYTAKFMMNYWSFNPATMHKLFRKWEKGELDETNETEKLFMQFMMNGGETGYTSVRDIEQHRNDISKALKAEGSKARRFVASVALQLDLANRSVENVARFAAFVTSRQMGRSLERSIYDAKEVSVNFNKKGSGGRFYKAKGETWQGTAAEFISSLGRANYAFWNPAIQGTVNFARVAKRAMPYFLTGCATVYTLGMLQPVIWSLLWDGDGDDEKDYYNLPTYTRRSNICIRLWDKWITIPLPPEMRALYGMGELAASAMIGKEKYTAGEIVFGVAEQLSQLLPIDMLEGKSLGTAGKPMLWLLPFAPTWAKPLAEIAANTSWTGLPIYKDSTYDEWKPEWQQTYKSTSKPLTKVTKWLNSIGNDDENERGPLGFINPAAVEHVLSGYLGGLYSTFSTLWKEAEWVLGLRDFEWRNTVLAGSVVKGADERTANSKTKNNYYHYKEEAEVTKRKAKRYEKGQDEGIEGMAEKYDFLYNSPEYGRMEIFERYRTDIDQLNRMKKEAASEGDEEAVADYDADILDAMRRMNAEMEEFDRKK